MGNNIQSKQAVVAEISSSLEKADSLILAEYRGVSVTSMTKLRAKARAQGVYLRVLKNTLVRRAVEGTSFSALTEHMVGPLVYGVSSDPLSAAKVMHDFSKTENAFLVKVGMSNGVVLDQSALSELASIPSQEELLARLIGVMQYPVSGFARALAALAAKQES